MSEAIGTSTGLAELAAFQEALSAPYTEFDRRAFEALFRCVRDRLSSFERLEAECLAHQIRQQLIDSKDV
jgi:hypothetical protein